MTKVSKVLQEYFAETGVQKTFFARKVGMHPNVFTQVLSSGLKLPKKYWYAVIHQTNGKVTATLLMEDLYSEWEDIHFEECEDPFNFRGYLTKFKKEN